MTHTAHTWYALKGAPTATTSSRLFLISHISPSSPQMCGTLFHNAAEGNMLYAPSKLAIAHVEAKLLAVSPPRPADEGDDGDAHEQHGADRHAGDDGG